MALRHPIKNAFGLSKSEMAVMQFSDLYSYADAIEARNFEKLPLIYNFTDEQLALIANVGPLY